MTEYLVVYETDGDGWSAYSPDLPGCFVAATEREEVEALMREAMPAHVAALRDAKMPVPAPAHAAGYVAA